MLEKNANVFIRYNDSIPILRKVQNKQEQSFSDIVSSRKPFGIATNFDSYIEKPFKDSIKIYLNRTVGYIGKNQIDRNIDLVKTYKLFVPKAIGSGNTKEDLIKPIIAGPNVCCSETYIVIGPFDDENTCKNVCSYINTKFFHFLVGLKKITQDATKSVYQFVPMQDFNEEWTDEKLYKKYKLTKDEIAFIESMVRPME